MAAGTDAGALPEALRGDAARRDSRLRRARPKAARSGRSEARKLGRIPRGAGREPLLECPPSRTA